VHILMMFWTDEYFQSKNWEKRASLPPWFNGIAACLLLLDSSIILVFCDLISVRNLDGVPNGGLKVETQDKYNNCAIFSLIRNGAR